MYQWIALSLLHNGPEKRYQFLCTATNEHPDSAVGTVRPAAYSRLASVDIFVIQEHLEEAHLFDPPHDARQRRWLCKMIEDVSRVLISLDKTITRLTGQISQDQVIQINQFGQE